MSFAVLTPATLLLLRWAMTRAGTAVVADADIATFFLTTRPGLLSLVVGGAAVVAITAIEVSCLMAIALAAEHGRRLTVTGALAFGASRTLPVLRLAANMVVRLLAGLAPFALAIGVVYWTWLRAHDINFFLSRRPPEFWIAVTIASLILAVLVALIIRTIGRWALALPIVLFDQVAPRHALAESARRLVPHRATAVLALAVWAGIAVVLLTIAAWVPDAVGRTLAPRFGGSMEMLLAFVAALVALWAMLALAASVINVALFALVLHRLFLHVSEPAAARIPVSEVEAARWIALPRSIKVGAAATALLAAIGAALIVASVARRNQEVAVIAHRGASAAAPENTLAAFRLAADEAADFVELDVQESADGEVVVVHDSDLMKVGGSPQKIWEATAASLRAVDIGRAKDPRFTGERVPTLAEALAACKGRVRVIVELKSYGHAQRLEQRVVEIVEASGMAADTVFMSLNHDMVREMKRLRPTWRVGALVATALGDLTSLGADFLAVPAGLATRSFVRQAHRAGQQVYVWTVNDPARMIQAMSRGVDGLITDLPALGRRVILRRNAMSDAQRILVALMVALGADTTAIADEQ